MGSEGTEHQQQSLHIAAACAVGVEVVVGEVAIHAYAVEELRPLGVVEVLHLGVFYVRDIEGGVGVCIWREGVLTDGEWVEEVAIYLVDVAIFECEVANRSYQTRDIHVGKIGAIGKSVVTNGGEFGNPNLRWEEQKQINVGLDFGAWNDRLNLSVDYFHIDNENLLMMRTMAASTGYLQRMDNVGCLTNQGVEFTLDQDIIKRKNFNWTMGLNFGLNRGTVVGLPEDVHEITGPQYGDVFTSAYLGGSTTALTGKDYQRNAEGQVIVDENGKTYSYEDRTPLDPEAKENKRPVYIEEAPNVPNDSLISAKVEKHKGQIEKYGYWGLVLFVGIPLPGTGAWTGCLIASVLEMDKKKSFLAAVSGVFIASVIMMLLSFGLLSNIV